MNTSNHVIHGKKRGPPPTGKTPLVALRVPEALSAKLDAWISSQLEPRPSRSEAIRRILAEALSSPGPAQRQTDASLDRQISRQEDDIAKIPEHSEPSPEAGMAAMDKALAENDLIGMKNKRTRRKNKRL
jgi:Arc/MetJ-type ribon-helix-helix transcriptional regulator